MDTFSKEARSEIMRRIKGKNTKPEILVRRLMHGMGYRFRLHRKDLPGKPDVVLPKYKTVVFVHGCFWHGHDCRKGTDRPSSNAEFWAEKIAKNIERDRKSLVELRKAGWDVVTVWECELKDPECVHQKLQTIRESHGSRSPHGD